MTTTSGATAESSSAASTANAPSENKRINVIFTPEQFATLERLADSQKITLSDALRQAINVADLIVKANADPGTQILIKNGNVAQELKLVR